MRRRPPDMSFTRFTYSLAMSLKMSLAPQEPCILITMGDCATEIIGAESAAAPAAPAAPVRNLRRVTALGCATTADCLSVMKGSPRCFGLQACVCTLAARTPDSGTDAWLMLIPGHPSWQQGFTPIPLAWVSTGNTPGGGRRRGGLHGGGRRGRPALALGRRMPALDHHENGKSEHVAHGYVPAVPHPLAHVLRVREDVRHRHPRARPEPDHRAAEPHGIGEQAP